MPAQNREGSAIDQRTVRHAGYDISQKVRKRVEKVFGWPKTVGGNRKSQGWTGVQSRPGLVVVLPAGLAGPAPRRASLHLRIGEALERRACSAILCELKKRRLIRS